MTLIVDTNPSTTREPSRADLEDQHVAPGDFFGTTGERGSQVWNFDGTRASRVGVPNPDERSCVALNAGESLREALCRVPMFEAVNFTLHKMELPPGAFYPRMSRPSDQHPEEAPGMLPSFWKLANEMASTLNQVRSFVGMLNEIFQVIHPAAENLSSYGGDIRNLLILACTECEAPWRGVLLANNRSARRLSTNEFVLLEPAMRLSEYAVKFQHLPWMEAVAPFARWDSAEPTKSISWYDDYNAAKHDRESAFNRATLKSTINAVAAVWIMVAAQFGIHGLREFDDLFRYFTLERVPLWRYSEVYTLGYDGFGSEGARYFPF